MVNNKTTHGSVIEVKIVRSFANVSCLNYVTEPSENSRTLVTKEIWINHRDIHGWLGQGEMEIRTYAVGTDLGKGVCVRM